MSTFDKREKGFESKYVHEQEIAFKAMARRNKLLGLWAAEKMGLAGEAAAAYAKEVVKADFDEPGDEDVFRKVFGDAAILQIAEYLAEDVLFARFVEIGLDHVLGVCCGRFARQAHFLGRPQAEQLVAPRRCLEGNFLIVHEL